MASVPARYMLEVEVQSASNLKNVNKKNGSLRPYVMASISDGRCSSSPLSSSTTPVISSKGIGTDPVWNGCKILLPLPRTADNDRVVLWLDVIHQADPKSGSGGRDIVAGSGCIFLNEIVAAVGVPGKKVCRAVELERPSGRRQGVLQVKVRIRHASTKQNPFYGFLGRLLCCSPAPDSKVASEV